MLFSANLYNEIVCLEPDPIAALKLIQNIKIHKFKNIIIEEKALAAETGKIKFGGNWDMGNSESTILVNDSIFLSNSFIQGQRGSNKSRTENIIEVDSITIEDILARNKILPDSINLIKMGIEGR